MSIRDARSSRFYKAQLIHGQILAGPFRPRYGLRVINSKNKTSKTSLRLKPRRAMSV